MSGASLVDFRLNKCIAAMLKHTTTTRAAMTIPAIAPPLRPELLELDALDEEGNLIEDTLNATIAVRNLEKSREPKPVTGSHPTTLLKPWLQHTIAEML